MAIEKDDAIKALQDQQLTTLTLQAIQKKVQDPHADFKATVQQFLSGHTDIVDCVAALPDGRVVSGSRDHTLKVWEVKTGKCVQTLSGHMHSVRCIAVVSNDQVLSGSWGILKVWDIKTEQCVGTLSGHADWILCVAILPNGRVVSGSKDGMLKVWDMKTGQCIQTLIGHIWAVSCVAVLPDGRLVSGSDDKTLKVWNTQTGQCIQTLSEHTNSIECVAVLPNGRVVSGSRDHTLKVWEVKTGKCVQTLSEHTNGIYCIALLPDGRMVSGSQDSTLKIWDMEKGKCVQTLDNMFRADVRTEDRLQALTLGKHTNGIYCVALLSDGRIVSGSNDKTLKVWEPEEKLLIVNLTPQDHATLLTAVQNNTSLTHLNLSGVPLANIPQGVNWLKAIVEKHLFLESLDLSNTGLTDAMFYKFFPILCARKCIEELNVEGNPLLSQVAKDQVKAYQVSLKTPIFPSPPIYSTSDKVPEFPKPVPVKSWHFDPLTERAATLPMNKNYALLPATAKDIQKVIGFYQHHPMAHYDIKKVEVIYNRSFNQGFELHLSKLQKRHNNPAFVPKWSGMSNPGLRQNTIDLFTQLTLPYTDPDYPAVKLLPAWHGTKPQVLDSIFSAGYANLATTDPGFFGKGYYSAYEAEYPYRVYSQGALILNWVASFSPLPVVGQDMNTLGLEGKSNYGNYDAHFVPVKPRSPDEPNETVYYPCQSLSEHQYTEIVVFDSAALLPRYLVELQPTLVKPMPSVSSSGYSGTFFPSGQEKEKKPPSTQYGNSNVLNN